MSRIKSIFILTLALCYCLVRGRAKYVRPIGEYGKVLVWQNAKLGDMVCTTPLLRAINKHFPCRAAPVRVSVVGSRINAEVLDGNPDVHEYISKSRKFFENVRNVRKSNPNAALLCQPDFESLAVLYLANVPLIVVPRIENGYSPLETRAYKILRRLVLDVPHRMGQYAPGEYLRLLMPFGVRETDTTKHLAFKPEGKQIEKSELMRVGIAPGAGNKIKQWPAERFAELADYLIERHEAVCYIFGGPGDKQEIEIMTGNMKQAPEHIFGAISINELKQRVSEMDLFIGVDTGPIYIAEAFGVPTVDITGPIDEHEQPPIGEYHLVVPPPIRQRPELYVMNAKSYNYAEARRQTESITTQMVKDACDGLIANIK